MSVFLTLGKSLDGDFYLIDSQTSGRGDLICPFCDVPLIAVKGKVKEQHFKHDGITCKESLTELPSIPGWDHFHLSLPQPCVDLINKGYNPDAKNKNVYYLDHDTNYLIKHNVIKPNSWTHSFEYTDIGKIVLGTLSVFKFTAWMRSILRQRYRNIECMVKDGCSHIAHRDIEAKRQQTLLNSSLYLFEFKAQDGNIFYKIGRTQQLPEQRLMEVMRDIRKLKDSPIKGKVLRCVPNAGFVEQYILYKYKRFQMALGKHKEYLMLDTNNIKKIKSELTRLKGAIEPFNKQERFITTGRWKYEEKRLQIAKRGIKLTLLNDGVFGRPKGTKTTPSDFLVKHDDVVQYLKLKFNGPEIVRRTGKSHSTVKRVKAAIKIIDG